MAFIMSSVKKYILTAVTLGLIAASGALLIAGANMVTKKPIEENEAKTINKGLASIFGDAAVGKETDLIKDQKIDYITTSYLVGEDNGQFYGYAFRTDGYNDYGKISLIIGFNEQCVYKGLSIIANEQSFATDLKKNYISKIKNGDEIETIDDVSVSCGATYGAKLVRSMVEKAHDAAVALDGFVKVAQNG